MADALLRLTHLLDQKIYLSLLHTLPTEQALASAPPTIRVQAAANYCAAQQAITEGFSATVFNTDSTACNQWHSFCIWIQISPDLKDIEDPIPFIQFFHRAHPFRPSVRARATYQEALI